MMTRELAAEIGVSRTPVRDALRQLEADGLVVIRPHVGASVKRMDVKEFREICGLRLALESYAAGLAAENYTVADAQELLFALDNMRAITEQIIQAPDEMPLLPALRQEDIRFHLAILRAAKNELVMKEILRLHLVNRVVSGVTIPVPPVSDKSVSDENRRIVLASHEEIYEAIFKRDAAGAKAAMEQASRPVAGLTIPWCNSR